ncbi:hypothetical protein HAX54_044968, partial [Datura stramonium]|nr:hypothetical protein [Datura stramonium]
GGEGTESDNEDPSADDAEESNDDGEEFGEDHNETEESSQKGKSVEESALNGKWNPSNSIQEEPKIRTNVLNEVLELKRLFEAYNIYWMDETPGKYSMDMVREFYANYYCTLQKNSPLRSAIKKEPVLDSFRVRAILVDISERTITRVLMGLYSVNMNYRV